MRSNIWARVVCRPALQKDTNDMLELTSHIWDGNDYVPLVWADWLADPDGFLAVAEYDGKVVGISMLECFHPGEWYLAGLRVHPEMEGRGIAARLNDYMLDYWQRQHHRGVVRLATHNPKVKHLCDRTGFHSIGEFTIFVSPSLPEFVETLQPLSLDQVDQATSLAVKSPVFEWHARLYGHGWSWSDLHPKYIISAVEKGCAWLWRDGLGVLVIGEDKEDDGVMPLIELLGCSQEHLTALLLDFRRLAARIGCQKAGWVASLHPELQPYLLEAGFYRDWDRALSVYELRAPEVVT